MEFKISDRSSDEEDDRKFCVKNPNNLSDWQTIMEQDILELRERILKLEGQNFGSHSYKRSCLSSSFITEDEIRFCGHRVCSYIIKSDRVVLLQIILLAIMTAVFLTFGITDLVRAKVNHDEELKPQRKYKTVDYGDEDNDTQYEFPNVYLFFVCWSDYQLNETISALLESQNYFRNSSWIVYMTSDFESHIEHLPVVEAKVVYEDSWVYDDIFMGYFSLKLGHPKTTMESFKFSVDVQMIDMTKDKSIWLDGFWVAVAREFNIEAIEGTVDLPLSNTFNGSRVYATVDYEEKIVRMWNNEYINYITASIGSYYEYDYDEDFEDSAGLYSLTFTGNLLVEYWEEYVIYSYYDWLCSTGGFFKIATIVFFFGAYNLAIFFGDKNSMGILPRVSKVYQNLENINMLKRS